MKQDGNSLLPKYVYLGTWQRAESSSTVPSRWNLSRKGIDLVSLACLICDSGIENINHTLWFCSLATSVWHRVFVWLDLHTPSPSNLQDLYNWIDDMHIVSSRKSIFGVYLWSRGILLGTIRLPFLGIIGFKTL
ncbi:RNA-directed DNA polymerase, eukaryota [Tanacetum coccineum]